MSKMLNVRLNESLFEEFDLLCKKNNTSRSEVIRILVENYINSSGKNLYTIQESNNQNENNKEINKNKQNPSAVQKYLKKIGYTPSYLEKNKE